jgi:long-chain acyl-CoA synthetase
VVDASGQEGELLVRGPLVTSGYHGMPEATAEAFTETGYLRTSDVGRRAPHNYYETVDRAKHVIVTAGYNVYPSGVEELLRKHEAVADATVVGRDDDRRNEVPVAYVVAALDTDLDVLLAEEVRGFVLGRAAEYKHPREVHFVKNLPRAARGKVQKFKLEERADGT